MAGAYSPRHILPVYVLGRLVFPALRRFGLHSQQPVVGILSCRRYLLVEITLGSASVHSLLVRGESRGWFQEQRRNWRRDAGGEDLAGERVGDVGAFPQISNRTANYFFPRFSFRFAVFKASIFF
jgi:hypothetical protein